jgi:hypothetical protein
MLESRLAAYLRATIERELPQLRSAAQERLEVHPGGPESWSPKQELGHLIDSAANNHQRFVRAALDGEYEGPGYAQNAWVAIHGYQSIPWDRLVSFWFGYNTLLAAVIENIPEESLSADCAVGGGDAVTLRFLIEDYVKHMQHHLDHLLGRETVTRYP